MFEGKEEKESVEERWRLWSSRRKSGFGLLASRFCDGHLSLLWWSPELDFGSTGFVRVCRLLCCHLCYGLMVRV